MDFILGCDLFELINKQRKWSVGEALTEEEARLILRETLLAVQSL